MVFPGAPVSRSSPVLAGSRRSLPRGIFSPCVATFCCWYVFSPRLISVVSRRSHPTDLEQEPKDRQEDHEKLREEHEAPHNERYIHYCRRLRSGTTVVYRSLGLLAALAGVQMVFVTAAAVLAASLSVFVRNYLVAGVFRSDAA